MTIYLTAFMIREIVDETMPGAQWRDLGLLESAAVRPMASFGGVEVYTSISEKAAALVHSLVTNDPLVDGNKRLGFLCLAIFLGLNGYRLAANQDELYDFILDTASGQMRDVEKIASWLEQHLESM